MPNHKMTRPWLLAAALCSAAPALAEEPAPAAAEPAAEPAPEAPAEDPVLASARAFITETVELIQKGKLKDYKARLHPAAMKAVEERNKKTKRDDHNLAFWTHVKEWKFQAHEITDITPGPRTTVVVTVKEDRFLIEEKGVDEGKDAEWLLVKNTGKGKPAWLILDRRNGGGNFNDKAIEKGFGDVLPAAEAGAAAAAAPRGTPQDRYVATLEGAIRGKFALPEGIPPAHQKNMKAIIRVMVDDNGNVQSRTVTKGSGNPDFDKALVRAVDAAQPLPSPEPGTEEAARKGLEITFRAVP